ncbi:MAG: phosphatidylglycerol lysyltransferase domain-containing protein [Bilophila sp.]
MTLTEPCSEKMSRCGATFIPFELEHQRVYAPYWLRTPQRTADYTFTNLWGWGVHYGLEWRIRHDLVWVRQRNLHDPASDALWAPVGDWEAADWSAMPELTPGTVMKRVPEALCTLLQERLPGRVQVEETPGQWEYLYTTQDLSTLAGNKLHKKRNHVNGYMKAYGEDYRPLTAENMEQVLALQSDWCLWRECEKSASLLAESDVVFSVLREWKSLPGLVGGALLVEGEMVAFAVGEPLDDTTLVVHFEKGRPNFRGVYQAINCCFAKYAAAGYTLIDREQDADEEGLRQAKESYYPTGFLKKNTVRFL